MRSVFGITYGPAKVGKTLAMCRAFPDGFFISPTGGLTTAAWLGWEVKTTPPKFELTIDNIKEIIIKAGKKYPAIIVDDFSLIVDAEVSRLKKLYASNPNKYAAWDRLNEMVYELRDVAREAPCHVFFTMHEASPREVRKGTNVRYIKGCPLIPGWQLPEKLPAMADFVARVVHDDEAIGWPNVYQTGPDAEYVTGDRLSITPPRFPLNLRELLLAAGYPLPRPAQLAWMEDVVEKTAQALLPIVRAEGDVKPVLMAVVKKLQSKQNPKHIRWAMADAMDRATLRLKQDDLLTDFVAVMSGELEL
jgi:hypothetical protein